MPDEVRLDLTSLESYRRSCLEIARRRLAGYSSVQEVSRHEDDLNAYPNLDSLSDPRGVFILDGDAVIQADLDRAREAVLGGRVFWEHTAAGEATRLKLGTKYLIFPNQDLYPLDKLAALMSDEAGREISLEELEAQFEAEPKDLLPLTLGQRHMWQFSFGLAGLARNYGRDPAEVLARQRCLLILNDKTAEAILEDTRRSGFFGLAPENCLFMIQPAFHGINVREGDFVFDPDSPRRLHNHGQLAMQETMDDQVFRLDPAGERHYLKSREFSQVLEMTLDKISYNIEDLDYLTGAVDSGSLALALKLGAQGYHMVMEIVANDPDHPIKGGMAAYDQVLGRDVMIESFQLKGIPNRDIKFLNKNFNHYTNPVVSWRALKQRGLPMPVAVKSGYIYFQPVQGDLNFLVRTALVQRSKLKPIQAWKSPAHTPAAVNAMWAQDNQPGFREFIRAALERAGD